VDVYFIEVDDMFCTIGVLVCGPLGIGYVDESTKSRVRGVYTKMYTYDGSNQILLF
jgi:hypothetical protein